MWSKLTAWLFLARGWIMQKSWRIFDEMTKSDFKKPANYEALGVQIGPTSCWNDKKLFKWSKKLESLENAYKLVILHKMWSTLIEWRHFAQHSWPVHKKLFLTLTKWKWNIFTNIVCDIKMHTCTNLGKLSQAIPLLWLWPWLFGLKPWIFVHGSSFMRTIL